MFPTYSNKHTFKPTVTRFTLSFDINSKNHFPDILTTLINTKVYIQNIHKFLNKFYAQRLLDKSHNICSARRFLTNIGHDFIPRIQTHESSRKINVHGDENDIQTFIEVKIPPLNEEFYLQFKIDNLSRFEFLLSRDKSTIDAISSNKYVIIVSLAIFLKTYEHIRDDSNRSDT